MDWSKAKTVLIIGLLITNLILGGAYISQRRSLETDGESFSANTAVYLERSGVVLGVPLPKETPRLPVLFVRLQDLSEEGGQSASSGSADADGVYIYNGYEVICDPSSGLGPVSVSAGETRQQVRPAAAAVLDLAGDLSSEELSGLVIEQIELVYWVDSGPLSSPALEDTAVPAWRFTTSRGSYYENAYE